MSMSNRGRVRAVVLGLGSMAILAPALLAQEPAATAPRPAKPAEKPAAKKAGDPGRRLPNYFGQIGVTPEQKDSIYAITSKYNAEIDGLERQIAAVRSKMMEEAEAVLTPTQRELLQNRRRSSGAAGAKVDATKAKG